MNAPSNPTTAILKRMDLIAGCNDITEIPALEALHVFGGWAIPGTNFHDMRLVLTERFGATHEFAIVGVHIGSQLVRQAVADILDRKDLVGEEYLDEIIRALELDKRRP